MCEDEFCGWKKKAKFWDKVAQDYFWSIPFDVLKHNIVHPSRRAEKKKQTCLKIWGAENPQQNKEIRKKTEQTNLKKYGKRSYLQTKEKQEKTKRTNFKKYGEEHHMKNKKVKDKLKMVFLERYGVENPQQNKNIKEKTIETFKERYNVENPSQVKDFQEKKIKTSLKNWGVAQPLSSATVRNKGKETIKAKFGVEHQMLHNSTKEKIQKTIIKKYKKPHFSKTEMFLEAIGKKKVLETGEYVTDWLKKQDEPKPSIVTVNQMFSKRIVIPLEELKTYISNYRNAKTNLERAAEILFETKHYNKKLKELKALYRPDFKLTKSVFVNVDGLYWHSEAQKDKWYHFNLRKTFEEADFRIIQFHENEIINQPHVVKSIVNNATNKTTNRLWARKCVVKFVNQKDANIFLTKNHLMGSTNAKHIGLFYKHNLISILSYKQRKNVCKIERFCSKNDYVIVGGFSKLLSYLEKNCLNENITEIHNWVDLRYGTGTHLKNKSFILTRETLGWKWTNGENTFNRLSCRANMDKRNLTQKEHAQELGWYKIYDAGQRLWIKYLKNEENA